MTSSRLLKLFAGLFLLSAASAVWLWYTTGEPPEPWLVRTVIATLLLTLVMSVVDADTRPRLMLRFLTALFALFALLAFATDIARPAMNGEAAGPISLLEHLQKLAPSFVAAMERSISHSAGPVVWDPILTSILSLPASLIFLCLAVVFGILGRPRRRVRIFVNDY